MITYEKRLDQNLDWALREGSMHFEEKSAVHQTLRKITRKLDELGIPYSVLGAMGLFIHGVRRFTEDVDLLVTKDGLKEIHRQLEGLGYISLFAGSKNLRDTENGVRVEFVIAGDYPGDGKPKPVTFPDPGEIEFVRDGMRVLPLPKMVELKLASGMTNPGRLKDLGDVQEVMKGLGLSADFANQLNPFVRAKYQELWEGVKRGAAEEPTE